MRSARPKRAGLVNPTTRNSLGPLTKARVLVTFNVAHFSALHSTWIGTGRHHAGIVVSSQRPIGDVVRRLIHLADTLDATAMQDRLEFLGDW